MKIAVFAPHTQHNGVTTISLLTGMQLAKPFKNVCITHSKPVSKDIYDYMNFSKNNEDIYLLPKFLESIKESRFGTEEIKNFCKKINNDVDVFVNNVDGITSDEMETAIDYIFDNFPYEHIILDMSNNNERFNRQIMLKCDVAILIVNQDILESQEFKKKREQFLGVLGTKPLIVIVNKYNPNKGTLQEMATWMGIKKPNNWLVLHENPIVCGCCNHGRFDMLFKLIQKGDPRVNELKADLEKLEETLIKVKQLADKQKLKK